MTAFSGFSPDFPRFLAALGGNNDTGWFNAHKAEYRALVQQPLQALLAALAPAMLAIDPAFVTDPRGAVSRIRRDVRFSRDKSPYRVNQWISFKRRGEGWPDRPAFFLELGPGGYRYGMGFYAASPATMAGIRTAIAARPHAFVDALAPALAAGFALEGDCYRRPRPAPDMAPEAALWFQRKNAFLCRNRPLEPLVFSDALPAEVATRLGAMADLYRFLSNAKSAP